MHVIPRDVFGAHTSAQCACIGVGSGAWRRRDTCGLVNDHVGSTAPLTREAVSQSQRHLTTYTKSSVQHIRTQGQSRTLELGCILAFAQTASLGWSSYNLADDASRCLWIKHLLSLTKNGSYSAIVWCTYSGTYAQFDPMIVFLCATAACTGLGWLVGPSFGSGVWNLLHRGQAGQMARRDKEFYDHIHRMRADASKHNVHKPMPDYYGEKIGSLHEYRHWLRKQVCCIYD